MALNQEEKDELFQLADQKQYVRLKGMLCEMNEADIAELFEELSPEKVLVLFRLLPSVTGRTAGHLFPQHPPDSLFLPARQIRSDYTPRICFLQSFSPNQRLSSFPRFPLSSTGK